MTKTTTADSPYRNILLSTSAGVIAEGFLQVYEKTFSITRLVTSAFMGNIVSIIAMGLINRSINYYHTNQEGDPAPFAMLQQLYVAHYLNVSLMAALFLPNYSNLPPFVLLLNSMNMLFLLSFGFKA